MKRSEAENIARRLKLRKYMMDTIGAIDDLERFANAIEARTIERCKQACASIDMESFGVMPVRAVMISEACAKAIEAMNDAYHSVQPELIMSDHESDMHVSKLKGSTPIDNKRGNRGATES